MFGEVAALRYCCSYFVVVVVVDILRTHTTSWHGGNGKYRCIVAGGRRAVCKCGETVDFVLYLSEHTSKRVLMKS